MMGYPTYNGEIKEEEFAEENYFLTIDEKNDLLEIFDILKNDKNLVNTKELLEGFKWLKFDRKEPRVFNLVEKVAEEGDVIDEETFLQIISELVGHKFTNEGREALFKTICKEDKEHLDVNDFKDLAKLNGDNIATAEMEEMVQQFSNHQGNIDIDSFKVLISRKIIGQN